MKAGRRLNFGFDRFSGLYIWALFIVVFTVWTPHLFPTGDTVHAVASSNAVGAMLGIAVLIPLAAGNYDLSVGATANLATIIAICGQTQRHWSIAVSIALAIAAAVVIGIINGFVVVRLRVNSFIATLGMASVIAAIQIIVSGNNQPSPPISTAWSNISLTNVAGFQIVFVYLLIIAIIFWWALEHTPVGRYLYAVGGSPDAARLSGINTGRWVWVSLITSSTLAGVAGVLYGSQSGPSLTYGTALLLPAYAAAFLGSTQLKPGRFNVWGTMLGVYVLATGIQGLQYVTGVQWLSDMFNGLALIAAVAFAVWRQRARLSRGSQADDPDVHDEEVIGSPNQMEMP